MKHLKLLLYAIMSICMLTACGGGDDDDIPGNSTTGNGTSTPTATVNNRNANDATLQPELSRLEFPHVKGGNSIVVVHKISDRSYDPDGVNYSIEWDCNKKSQRWCCYIMHKTGKETSRSDAWSEDPDIPKVARFTNSQNMYSGSGYTRGHICASADRLYSVEANMQTFYYSNMQPQLYDFNAGNNYTGIWVNMEQAVQRWATEVDTLYVCKGGTIDDESQIMERITKYNTDSNGNRVQEDLIVPKYFFMALVARTKQGYKALAFWTEHTTKPCGNLADYVINIDKLEEKTGIDFFCNLPDNIENNLEGMSVENIKSAWNLK